MGYTGKVIQSYFYSCVTIPLAIGTCIQKYLFLQLAMIQLIAIASQLYGFTHTIASQLPVNSVVPDDICVTMTQIAVSITEVYDSIVYLLAIQISCHYDQIHSIHLQQYLYQYSSQLALDYECITESMVIQLQSLIRNRDPGQLHIQLYIIMIMITIMIKIPMTYVKDLLFIQNQQ